MKSDTHKNLQKIVRDYYKRQGWIAIIEHCIKGKKIDILAQNIRTKYTIANEIQLTSKHSIENVILDINKTGCDEVRVISTGKITLQQMKEEASKKLSKNLLGKVKFQLIEEFLPHSNNRNNDIK